MATTMGTQVETLKNYVAGQWVEATATEMQAVRNPATDDVLAHVPLSNAEDVDTAVRAAAAAFPPGARLRLRSGHGISSRCANSSSNTGRNWRG